VFVPKLPTMNICDLAKAICPDCILDEVGIRPGEKLHEMLIPNDETGLVLEYPDHYVIRSRTQMQESAAPRDMGTPMPQGFEYGSSDSTWKISIEELRSLIGQS
jgi:UDP-N-acetylglucosamine 4,6-dehydratase